LGSSESVVLSPDGDTIETSVPARSGISAVIAGSARCLTSDPCSSFDDEDSGRLEESEENRLIVMFENRANPASAKGCTPIAEDQT